MPQAAASAIGDGSSPGGLRSPPHLDPLPCPIFAACSTALQLESCSLQTRGQSKGGQVETVHSALANYVHFS